jgi:hypothetical protein
LGAGGELLAAAGVLLWVWKRDLGFLAGESLTGVVFGLTALARIGAARLRLRANRRRLLRLASGEGRDAAETIS